MNSTRQSRIPRCRSFSEQFQSSMLFSGKEPQQLWRRLKKLVTRVEDDRRGTMAIQSQGPRRLPDPGRIWRKRRRKGREEIRQQQIEATRQHGHYVCWPARSRKKPINWVRLNYWVWHVKVNHHWRGSIRRGLREGHHPVQTKRSPDMEELSDAEEEREKSMSTTLRVLSSFTFSSWTLALYSSLAANLELSVPPPLRQRLVSKPIMTHAGQQRGKEVRVRQLVESEKLGSLGHPAKTLKTQPSPTSTGLTVARVKLYPPSGLVTCTRTRQQ
jgi:hypothetical protein